MENIAVIIIVFLLLVLFIIVINTYKDEDIQKINQIEPNKHIQKNNIAILSEKEKRANEAIDWLTKSGNCVFDDDNPFRIICDYDEFEDDFETEDERNERLFKEYEDDLIEEIYTENFKKTSDSVKL